MYEYATQIAPFYNKLPPTTEAGDYTTIETFLEIFNDIHLSGKPLVCVKIDNIVQAVWAMYAERLRKPIGRDLVKKLQTAGKLGQLSTVSGRKIGKYGEYNRAPVPAVVIASTYEFLQNLCNALPKSSIPIMTFRFGIVVDNCKATDIERALEILSPNMPLITKIWEVR